MDDVKDKMKGFMKKVNNSFTSSSSAKFKGQGRVLGSSSSPSPPPYATANSTSTPRPRPLNSNPTPPPHKATASSGERDRKPPTSGFDPFDSFVTSSKRSQNGYSLNVYECPVCGNSFRSEDEVSEHVDTCLSNNGERADVSQLPDTGADSNAELEVCVGTYVSGKPSHGSIDILLKLLKNVVREPENAKFRKIRLGNPKIKEAVAEVIGGTELICFLGFELKDENGETWAVMELPSEEQIRLIKKATLLLESQLVLQVSPKSENLAAASADNIDAKPESKPIDRQVKVFFAVPETVAAKIELPDSFYKLSVEEVRREAELRRKKIEESQLLIPKSLKEKQAKAAKKRYTKAIIRVQFPDGVVLQGVFSPWEPTMALYEFVSSALKQPGLEFELMHPVVVRRQAIPRFAKAGENSKTLEDEDLVPSALIKFKPLETDSVVFTGLKNELLQISEPLVNA
ncbi:hypothetical protein HN51_013817 [Arachis hypogaea]|uniref:UBX domain-containing protein n=1 Tax=Arachis hypogaea TaxID=3818 RepID=A0A445DNJ9_ARAHY|nr:plant UBX domain-containing protein 2 [Arachis ipaensis]XP_025639180.1 plant UBX domain-containing protein 2 [Arachis hypogaea]QHO59634.1 Plant UBX domain-containing protein [Arachis hypogaea]RYR64754.1 hypothetical protein Ahy_A03g010813 [Arachis hypogaea]